MLILDEPTVASTFQQPVVVCVLGRFRVLQRGSEVPLRVGGKAETLLGMLALRLPFGASRDAMIDRLWPDAERFQSRQSLNTLIYSLHRLLGDALGGQAPISVSSGEYRLNTRAGVVVDVDVFEAAANAADQLSVTGDSMGAIRYYREAVACYTGDLAYGSDIQALLERERLRARHLAILARLAEHYFLADDYAAALNASLTALSHEPCREDLHRMAMRCLVRLGWRAQALRQYRLCRDVLSMEFDAPPEPATEELFELIRRNPAIV